MKCEYGSGEAAFVMHDSRGCYGVCETHALWRRYMCSRTGGHHSDCPHPNAKTHATHLANGEDAEPHLASLPQLPFSFRGGNLSPCKGMAKVVDGRPPLTHVACRDTTGRIWSLPRPLRHHHVLAVMHQHGAKCAEDGHFSQGFLDESGRYLHRKAALVSAELNGQIKGGKLIGSILMSEDLW